MFTSGLDSGHMDSSVVIVMNISLMRHVCKISEAGEINSLIAKAVNESSFVVLGGDFNENSLCKSASFKRCLDLGLINSLSENLKSVKKTIDFVLVLSNLVNAVVDHNVVDAVSVSVGLGSLLDTQLNSLHRQANRNCWKFDFRSANNTNAEMFANEFATTVQLSDLDIFRKKWFKNFDGIFTRDSLRFYKLKLLVSKLVKASYLVTSVEFASFLALAKIKKSYCSSKLLESRHAEEACVKAAINKRMRSFESDKGHIIRSVLECSFHKVVLDYLVVSDKLVLEPSLVKSRVDEIMKDEWFCQYWPLENVFNDAFSDMMCPVGVDDLLGVVSNLLEGKAADFSGILNELWKHCDKSVLDMLLVLLNSCLIHELIPGAWKEAWDGVLMNTQSIALIETAHKILSKILSDRILSAYSTFDVLHENNFLVLKGMMMQSPIFAIGLVVKDALKKDRELWLVLQNMQKIKKQTDECGYRLNSYFIFGCGHAKSWAGLSSFFIMNVFVNDTIWVGSSRSVTQHILNIASEFFDINDISINNDKTVAIPINCKVADPFLLISGLLIFIAKRGKSHCYLGIYLLTEGLSKPSLAKAHFNVQFFANLVLKKAVSNKQFSYLVLAVLFLIIGYRTQFSYVLVSVCENAISANLLCSDIGHFSVYMDGFLSSLELVDMKTGAAAIALALECVPPSCSINLFSDSQAALDACKLELNLVYLDFRNWYWIKHYHIMNIIHHKNLNVNWCKVKGHLGVSGNKHADKLARAVALSSWNLLYFISKHYLRVGGAAISGNSKHFVWNVFQSVYCTHWEIGSGLWMVMDSLCVDIDWFRSLLVWHPDSYMAVGFTSKWTAGFWTYFMKALHLWLPVVMHK
ncbi:hypothetical protein G9A89_012120 [Geosiphon pyriformis]|nr:hypothetical protein G9A89_012120 [Geosiphon pyriformis]